MSVVEVFWVDSIHEISAISDIDELTATNLDEPDDANIDEPHDARRVAGFAAYRDVPLVASWRCAV